MSSPQQEKRATRRFSLRLPVSIRFTNGGVQEFSAETRDVSARGVFFYVDKRLSEGSNIEFTLTLPPEITLTESIRVRCKGRVVRVEESAEERVGVGAIIDQYDFVAES
jgi:PilZ domain